jgi:hypothetical protein
MRRFMDVIFTELGIEETIRTNLVDRFRHLHPEIQKKYLKQQRQLQSPDGRNSDESLGGEMENAQVEVNVDKEEDKADGTSDEDDTRNEGGTCNEHPAPNPYSREIEETTGLVSGNWLESVEIDNMFQDDASFSPTVGAHEYMWDLFSLPSNVTYHTAPASLPASLRDQTPGTRHQGFNTSTSLPSALSWLPAGGSSRMDSFAQSTQLETPEGNDQVWKGQPGDSFPDSNAPFMQRGVVGNDLGHVDFSTWMPSSDFGSVAQLSDPIGPLNIEFGNDSQVLSPGGQLGHVFPDSGYSTMERQQAGTSQQKDKGIEDHDGGAEASGESPGIS